MTSIDAELAQVMASPSLHGVASEREADPTASTAFWKQVVGMWFA